MKKAKIMQLILLAMLIALPLGCAKKPVPQPEAGVVTGTTPTQQQPAPAGKDGGVQESRITEEPAIADSSAAPAAQAAQSTPELQRIFFEYNQYTLTPEARQVLAANAEYMKQRQGSFVVEGHSDERGSDEYNLALGERRAQAARDYLISLGVPGDRLSIVSYGEERPLEKGSSEEAWAKNRRAEFLLR